MHQLLAWFAGGNVEQNGPKGDRRAQVRNTSAKDSPGLGRWLAEEKRIRTSLCWRHVRKRFFHMLKNFFDWIGKLGYGFCLGVTLALGVLVLALFAYAQKHTVQVFAVELLIAGAASGGGVLVGFLFGIPRTLQERRNQPSNAPVAGNPEVPASRVNTNLEEISDWLTKIIVGVGLVQLNYVPEKMMEMGDYLSDAFGIESPIPGPVVNLIIWYFAIFCFLLGYLWTRLYLASEFTRAERATRETTELYEGAIHACLYEPRPTGFEKAISYGDYYKGHFGENNARVASYLALAYGQKYAYTLPETETNKEELKKIRAKALEAVRQAIRIHPDSRTFLYDQWNKNAKDPEADLQMFADDPEFKIILGEKSATVEPPEKK